MSRSPSIKSQILRLGAYQAASRGLTAPIIPKHGWSYCSTIRGEMTARFAGSRSLDERRRRRLSQESNDETGASIAVAKPKRGETRKSVAATKEVPESTPDESFVPRSSWRIAVFGMLLVLGWGTTLLLGLSPWFQGTGLEDVLGYQQGRLAAFFSTACLFAAAQVSSVILWYRSRCRKDFMGRYRVWAWVATFYVILSLCNATGLHVPITHLLVTQWPVSCWRPEIMYWLAPTAIGALAAHQLLIREVHHRRASLWMVNVCFILGALAGALHLAGDLLLAPSVQHPVTRAVTTLWHASILLMTVVHARYVVHVSSEAPPQRVRGNTGILARFAAWPGRIRQRLAASKKAKPAKVKAEKVTDKTKSNSSKSKPTRRSKKAAIAKTAESVSTDSAAEELSASENSAVDEFPTNEPSLPVPAVPVVDKVVTPKSSERHLRVDAAVKAPVPQPHLLTSSSPPLPPAENADEGADEEDDDQDFSRMSKKERRRQKKQHRQETRNE